MWEWIRETTHKEETEKDSEKEAPISPAMFPRVPHRQTGEGPYPTSETGISFSDRKHNTVLTEKPCF